VAVGLGFAVLAVSDYDGELESAVETTAELGGLSGVRAVAELHDRRPCWVRDLPTARRPVALVWSTGFGAMCPRCARNGPGPKPRIWRNESHYSCR
jgi:hypothetical protein